jgi:hypothetical protein
MTITPEHQARYTIDPTADPVTDVIPVVPAPGSGATPWPSTLRTREHAATHRGTAVAERGPKRRWPWATAGLAVGLLMGVGIGGAALGNAATATAAPAPAPQTVTVTAPAAAPETVTVTAAAPAPVTVTREVPVPSAGTGSSAGSPDGVSDGVHQVGTDIPAGRYKTEGPSATSIIPNCYYARLKNDSGEFDAIIANDNLQGPGSVTLKKGEFVEFSGGCTWTKVG